MKALEMEKRETQLSLSKNNTGWLEWSFEYSLSPSRCAGWALLDAGNSDKRDGFFPWVASILVAENQAVKN